MKKQKKWIKKAIKRPGAFKAKAKRAGMSTSATAYKRYKELLFTNKELKKGSRYSTRTKRQASLARTLGKMRKTK